jgi:hypothetical protein
MSGVLLVLADSPCGVKCYFPVKGNKREISHFQCAVLARLYPTPDFGRIGSPFAAKLFGQMFFLSLNCQLLCQQSRHGGHDDEPELSEIEACCQHQQRVGDIDGVAAPGEGARGDQIYPNGPERQGRGKVK